MGLLPLFVQAGQTHGQFKTDLCVFLGGHVLVVPPLGLYCGEYGADLWHGWALYLLEAIPFFLVYLCPVCRFFFLPHCVSKSKM